MNMNGKRLFKKPLKAFMDGNGFLRNTAGLIAHAEKDIGRLESI